MKSKKKKIQKENGLPIYILAALTIVSLIIMISVLSNTANSKRGKFIPPEFESNAVTGVPDVPEGFGYSSPYQDGMAYRFSVCGNVIMDGKNATVYLTNAEENAVFLKLRVLDTKGNVLGETGLLKPGEYVEQVELNESLAPGTEIKLKIMGYEPDTYLSAGSAVLSTQIGGTQ